MSFVQSTEVNDKNIYSQYQILLVKGAYKALTALAENKASITNTSRNEGGTRYTDNIVRKAEREFTLTIVTTQKDAATCEEVFNEFTQMLEAAGTSAWKVRARNVIVYLRLKKHSEVKPYVNGALITATKELTLVEINPDNRDKIQ
jgi:hypothetical protein